MAPPTDNSIVESQPNALSLFNPNKDYPYGKEELCHGPNNQTYGMIAQTILEFGFFKHATDNSVLCNMLF